MNRKLKNILIALVVGFFALVRAAEVVEPIDPLGYEHEIDPRYDEGYDETSSGRSTPEPGEIAAQNDRRDSGISTDGDIGLISPDTSLQMPKISDTSGSLPQTDLPTVTTTAQPTFDNPTQSLDITGLHENFEAIDSRALSPEEKQALKREFLANEAAKIFDEATSILSGLGNVADVDAINTALMTLQGSNLLTPGEKDFINLLRKDMKSAVTKKINENQFKLSTLRNVKEAFDAGNVSLEQAEQFIKDTFKGGTLPSGAAEIITAIRKTPVNVAENVLGKAQESAQLVQIAHNSFAQESQKPMDTIIKALKDNYSPDQDSLVRQAFNDLAQKVFDTDRVINDALSKHQQIDLLTTSAVTVGYSGMDVLKLMDLNTLSKSEKLLLAEKQLLGFGNMTDDPFTQKVESLGLPDLINGLLNRVGNNPDIAAALRLFEADPVKNQLTKEQKIQLADAWIAPLRGLPLDVMPHNDLAKIARTREINIENDTEKQELKQAYRDLTQDFSDPDLFRLFLRDYVFEDGSSGALQVTSEQKQALKEYRMNSLSDSNGPSQLASQFKEMLTEIKDLYSQWQQKKAQALEPVSSIGSRQTDILKQIQTVKGKAGLFADMAEKYPDLKTPLSGRLSSDVIGDAMALFSDYASTNSGVNFSKTREADIAQTLSDLAELSQNEGDLLSKDQLDLINKLRTTLENMVEHDVALDQDFLVNTLRNLKDAFQAGHFTITDVESIIAMSLEGRSVIPQEALVVIKEIRTLPVDKAKIITKELDVSQQIASKSVEAFNQASIEAIATIKDLMQAGGSQEAIGKVFDDMVEPASATKSSLQEALSLFDALAGLSGIGDLAFGDYANLAELLKVDTVPVEVKQTLVDLYLLSVPSDSFNGKVDAINQQAVLEDLKTLVKNDPQVSALLGGDLSQLTVNQKLQIADAILNSFKTVSINEMPIDLLRKMALAYQDHYIKLNDKHNMQLYRDAGIPFRNHVLASIARGGDLSLDQITSIQETFMNMDMSQSAPALQSKYNDNVNELNQLYQKWQSESGKPVQDGAPSAQQVIYDIEENLGLVEQDIKSTALPDDQLSASQLSNRRQAQQYEEQYLEGEDLELEALMRSMDPKNQTLMDQVGALKTQIGGLLRRAAGEFEKP